MNLSVDLQQAIAEWTETQGISTEEFIEQAIVEKLNRLQRSDPLSTIDCPMENSSRLRRKNGILILETASEADLDINTWIDQLREERIQEQMSL
jgi:hypothetical protein